MKLSFHPKHQNLFVSLANTHFQAMCSDSIHEQDSAGTKYTSYPDGYSKLHQSLDRFYESLLSSDEQKQQHSSSIYTNGLSLVECPSQDSVAHWDNFISSSSERNIMYRIIQDEKLFSKFLDDWLSVVNSPEIVKQQGCKVVLYNALTDILISEEDRLSVSGKWHYDNYTPPDYLRYIIYLNDSEEHGGGIDVACADSSKNFSNKSGYIGLPLNQRLSDVSNLEKYFDATLNIERVRAKKGEMLVFNPSRCLHRGINPTKSPRKCIFLCALPISIDTSDYAIKLMSQSLVGNQVHGNDIIPLFRKKPEIKPELTIDLSTPGNYSDYLLSLLTFRTGVLEGSFEHGLLEILCSRPQPSESVIDAIREIYTDVYFAARTDSIFHDLFKKFHSLATSIEIESRRYSITPQKLRSHIYWPDPTHPKYPSHLYTIKPFVTKKPLVSKQTVISTAGSCFAYEIARYLQSENYNYLVTEKPSSSEGVMSSDYTEQDKFVPFSANFGILFNSPSLKQLAFKAFRKITLDKILEKRDNYYHDPYRESIYFRTKEAYLNDYDSHLLAVQRMFLETEVFIFTMGLNECWRLTKDESVISRNPDSNVYPFVKHVQLTVDDNIKELSTFFNFVKQINPKFKLILTVSPIPFLATGLSDSRHVVEANCHSKSVLRVAAQHLADTFEDIHYFPSYELISYCLDSPWEDDLRHVKKEAVQQVVSMFKDVFFDET